MVVKTIEDLSELLCKMEIAQKEFATFSQEKVDKIFAAAAIAANAQRVPLAMDAVKETRLGIVEDKAIKNSFASEYVLNYYRHTKTCGVISEDPANGTITIAEPLGIIAGILPTTNPTSTCIFKSLLSIKTRNAIIFSPHPRAKECSIKAAKIVLEAAVAAGAPDHIIGWIDVPSVPLCQELMKHDKISTILATGGKAMVVSAYSSGRPAIGVGPGCTPAVVDETANVKQAVASILMSKAFDNGVVCASEQVALVHEDVFDMFVTEAQKLGGYVLDDEQREKVEQLMFPPHRETGKRGALNVGIVGQRAMEIAKMAGIEDKALNKATKALIGIVGQDVEKEWFCHEKLSPTLGLVKVSSYEEGRDLAARIIEAGGLGHTATFFTSPIQKDRMIDYGKTIKVGRILINCPASQGAIGDLWCRLAPSLTLPTGSWGGSSLTANLSVNHLINTKIVAQKVENPLWFRNPPKIFFKRGCTMLAAEEVRNCKRAFIVTDTMLVKLGMVEKLRSYFHKYGIATHVYSDVKPDPKLFEIMNGVKAMREFGPDLVIGFGGGSPMDAAKIMRLLYEHPDADFRAMAITFLDIRKRSYRFPSLLEDTKTKLMCVSTTSGTGSEVTPFAVVTDEKTGIKYPLADYELTPQIAVVDADFVMDMPRGLTAATGMDVLTHAIESYVSVIATEFTQPYSLQAIKLIFDYLPSSYEHGAKDPIAREKVHNAAAIAGMAFASGFLGICHSLAHKLGQQYHIPHGLANALLLVPVIRFQCTENPTKQGIFPQYLYPQAVQRYAEIAKHIGCTGKDEMELVDGLCKKIVELNSKVGIPEYISQLRTHPSREEYFSTIEALAVDAFDDQCTGASPTYPLIEELYEIYKNLYEPLE
ncbi:Aldehyde-alcohol dehydrogenase [Aduncisulcus paluster]|uniref:Aldehyde-alcohol dehydrogenase n=1 Tax=Aduncisulcus paluster TaxID=2918883 RepID=A0ABQ5KJ57_9EUKA|nr:Aldehyde-alcohol dehydrogenase [Aduncisulcus paluster]|eukprot:gnl/Carplike_NY0171/264_a375_3016.p1 GENE.gnl/Carplike_NY0171/264_a375_3016~~gnl/Carplike_NY0171/264_a375_3016.p1  ORF type:complete len:884 (+),score=343.56 gnl/Carplike_NY0171/264_a375_3016:28-2652(+)